MRSNGFSLVELMVTIAVLVLALMTAMPSLGKWMDNTQIRNAADSLQNGLMLARNEAVRRNQPVSFWLVALTDPAVLSNDCTLSSTSGSWVVSVNSPVAHCADAPSTTTSPMLVTGRPAGSGNRFTVNALQSDGSTAATTITFNGFGRITNSSPISQINVTGTSTRNLRIVISSAGLVRMCDPDSSVAADDPRKC